MGLVKGIVASSLIAINTIANCAVLYAMALLRAVTPVSAWRDGLTRNMDRVIDSWVSVNRLIVRALRLIEVRVEWVDAESLSRDDWYMVISNHQTWADIIILQNTLRPRIPPLKFFTKEVLIWIPFLGVAMKFLGFPYVRRASREAIAANPALREHDRQVTQNACTGFKQAPVSVLNFLEGTRFTPAKQLAQDSPYKGLLKPKPGGLGYVLTSLAHRIDTLVDVTIRYPGGVPTFWEFLCGSCQVAEVRIASVSIPAEFMIDELADEQRQHLRNWIDAIWHDKDRRVTNIET
jgi:1-acyl-sn-glycerol-3-phosphate acyltransferase